VSFLGRQERHISCQHPGQGGTFAKGGAAQGSLPTRQRTPPLFRHPPMAGGLRRNVLLFHLQSPHVPAGIRIELECQNEADLAASDGSRCARSPGKRAGLLSTRLSAFRESRNQAEEEEGVATIERPREALKTVQNLAAKKPSFRVLPGRHPPQVGRFGMLGGPWRTPAKIKFHGPV